MNFLKRLWKKLWSKTEVDDIVIERAKRVKEELKDVGASLKEGPLTKVKNLFKKKTKIVKEDKNGKG